MEEAKDWQSESSHSLSMEDSSLPPSPRPSNQRLARLRDFNPLRLFQTNFAYHQIPSFSTNSSTSSLFSLQSLSSRPSTRNRSTNPREPRWKLPQMRMTTTKFIAISIAAGVVLMIIGHGGYHYAQREDEPQEQEQEQEQEHGEGIIYDWMHFNRLQGYFNGIRTLVPYSRYIPDNGYNQTEPSKPLIPGESNSYHEGLHLDPEAYNPYPDFDSPEYLRSRYEVHACFLDEAETIPSPDIYAYPGMPQHMPEPFFGSYEELGLEGEKCFDRFGRFGPYGYGQGGSGPGNLSENFGSDKILKQFSAIDYSKMDWGQAQRRCLEKNKARFEDSGRHGTAMKRQAYVLRTWTGYNYNEHQILTMRAMINELSLKSGGEYDVHLLVHVKDDSIPIWASDEIYRKTLEENIPREFWNISTLWSEQLMRLYYPSPFIDNSANMAEDTIHGVYRSAHFAMQWFSQQHPEYEHYWNWEMDLRYSGHYWEFHNALGEWGEKQPRKGLWERNRRFWIPKFHGDYQNFTKFVEQETLDKDIIENDPALSGPMPVWGPVNEFPNGGMLNASRTTIPPSSYADDDYEWGVGEDADLLTFNPIFDPALTNWVFRMDTTGYDNALPLPPRRAAIITVARLSKRLLDTMHEETWRLRHTMFPEMWPPTVAFHHGLKAVYVPHPVFFDHDWDLWTMDQRFNHPATPVNSPFGWGEHNMFGGSFYYSNTFAGLLWRRWLGMSEDGAGGRAEEEAGTGRMCLRGMLHHPVKHEAGPLE